MIHRIEAYYRQNELLTDEEIDKMIYAIKSIWNDVIKFLMMGILAIWIGQLPLFLWIVIPLISSRVFIGGLHKKSFWGCFLFTSVQIFGLMALAIWMKQYLQMIFVVAMISVLVVPLTGPIPSKEKRALSPKRKKAFTMVAVSLELGWLLSSHYMMVNEVYQAGICLGILLNNAVLIILWIQRRRKKE